MYICESRTSKYKQNVVLVSYTLRTDTCIHILLICCSNLAFTNDDFGNRFESFKTMKTRFYSPLYYCS